MIESTLLLDENQTKSQTETTYALILKNLQLFAAGIFAAGGAISAAPFFWLEPCSFKELFTGEKIKNFTQLSTGWIAGGEILGVLSYIAFAPFATRNNWRLIKGLKNPNWKDWKTYARTGALLLIIPSGAANAYNMYLFLGDPTINAGKTAQWLLITPALVGPGIGNYKAILELGSSCFRDIVYDFTRFAHSARSISMFYPPQEHIEPAKELQQKKQLLKIHLMQLIDKVRLNVTHDKFANLIDKLIPSIPQQDKEKKSSFELVETTDLEKSGPAKIDWSNIKHILDEAGKGFPTARFWLSRGCGYILAPILAYFGCRNNYDFPKKGGCN